MDSSGKEALSWECGLGMGVEPPAESGTLPAPRSGGTPVPKTFSHGSSWTACHEARSQLNARKHIRTPGFGQKTVPLLPSGILGDCSAMTTARYRPTWDLALDPLVSCKLCLGEYPVEQMTTIAQCQCIFCTLCLKQYVELLIKEGLETAISCPDAACPKQGHLQEDEIECMVAAEIMQRYKKLQFEREVLLDPCRTWCPASACQAVCQLQEMGLQTPQLVQCKACDMEFCSACKASWHPGQGCPETLPITFLPGETSSPCAESLLAHPSSPESARLSLCLPLTTLLSLETPCRPQIQGSRPSFVRIPRSQGRAADPTVWAPHWRCSAFKVEEDDAPIKRCPKCKVYIERDEGCAQMMCKNCKHAFCWYCLESLDSP
ncbi:E3 ubiquitin-protein ligase RNF144A isoform X5 [Mirounga angustirostris]|uniref:E3 ubiquitin-protein ligase RNF144A isoform X5 n=1 Tax=Mirounga angustirostris TaxID=9716 RepID=UPI00313A8EAB